MDAEDCLLLIKRILDLTDSNAKLTARVESLSKELRDSWAACASLQLKIGNAENSPNTKAMEIANASIYSLTNEVSALKTELGKFKPFAFTTQ